MVNQSNEAVDAFFFSVYTKIPLNQHVWLNGGPFLWETTQDTGRSKFNLVE